MVEKLFTFLPADTTLSLSVIYAALCAGAVLWALGAKISRSLFTLGMVAAGCAAGRRSPAWFGWQIDPMATGVGGAVIAGVLGYSLHRIWVAMSLGLTLAVWGALGVWIHHGSSDPFPWPPVPDPFSSIEYMKGLWQSIPGDVAHMLPIVCGTLYVTGFAFAIFWHRHGTALLHSLLGTTLLVVGGLLLAQTRYPQWLGHLPPKAWIQYAVIAAMVLAGMRVQWMLTWRRPVSAVIEPIAAPPAED